MLNFQSISGLIPNVTGKIYLGYSGGIDSQVLLHVCATQASLQAKLVAVYVHHGLLAVADDWGLHCQQQAEIWGVEFIQLRVDARALNGESPEAAARHARYQALQALLTANDALLLAQHREDQMETLLLQLFRGAGVQGMAAMPEICRLGLGVMARPLLHTAKSAIVSYAEHHALQWVEDPSNQSSDFDRNFLRNQVVPLLKQRWSGLDKTVARAAVHCAEAAQTLNRLWQRYLAEACDADDQSLAMDKLLQLNAAEQRGVLRAWLLSLGLQAPSQAVLTAVTQQLIAARDDAQPQVFTQGHYLKKYRRRLFCLAAQRLQIDKQQYTWPHHQSCVLLANGYQLSKIFATSGISQRLWLQATVTIQSRQAGETLKLAGRAGRHGLKKLYQEAGIPPWERETRPLIYLNGQLAAVAGLWVAEWALGDEQSGCYQIIWQPS